MTDRSVFRRSERVLAIVGSLALALAGASLLIYFGIRDFEDDLDRRVGIIENLMSQRLGNGFGVLASLSGVQQASEELSNTQLTAISDQLRKQYTYLGAIGYLTWTLDEDRTWLEESVREGGHESFKVRDIADGEPTKTAAEPRPVYLPLSFIEPMGPTTARWLGADLLTDEHFAEMFELASKNGSVEAALLRSLGHDTPRLFLLRSTYFGHYIPESASERLAQRSGAFILVIDIEALTQNMVDDDVPPYQLSFQIGNRSHNKTVGDLNSSWLPAFSSTHTVPLESTTLSVTLVSRPNLTDVRASAAAVVAATLLLVMASLMSTVKTRRLAARAQAQAALELEQSQAQYRDLFEGSIQGVIIHREMDVLFVNQSFVSMLEFDSRDALLGPDALARVIPDEGQLALAEAVQTLKADPEANLQIEWNAICSNGRELVLVDSMRYVTWEGGPAIQSTVMNITERKAAEKALIKVSERALAAAQAKSDFLANMSHELRTPMNGVLGMMELLRSTALDTTQAEYVDIAHSSGDALLALINDVLDISKLEAGKLDLEQADFSVSKSIETVIERLAANAHKNGVELVYDQSDEIPAWSHGDSQRVGQVITNLVGNAIKFTESGSIVLRTTRTSSASGKALLRISVADEGIGIPDDRLASIFEAFTQADTSTTRKYGGTGLGLAISRQLVERMGGRIGVESTVGVGSEFWFTIAHHDPVEAHPELTSVTNPGNVLIVDRDAKSASALASVIERLGGTITVVTTTDEIETRALEPRYDVVFVDDWWTDGPAEAKRRLVDNRDIHSGRWVLTGHLSEAASPADLAAFDARVSKPVSRSRLIECLRAPFEAAAKPVRPSAQPSESDFAEASILVVEDNMVNQRVAIGILGGLGFKADIANNGAEALEALENRDYDIVLMDCQMPVLDGYATTRRIRELEAEQSDRRRLPIVALTANAMEGDEAKCLAAGMDDYLSKPLRPDALKSTIVRWLTAEAA